MTTQDSIIKTAYELENLTPDQIAEDQGLNLIAVKAKLMEVSTKYRKDCGKEPENESRLNFSNNDLETVNQIIMETALAAERSDGSIDWKTRLEAACYIRDDKKGRKEVKSILAGNTFNILNLSEKLSLSNQRAAEMKRLVEVK
jgi:hypothetical protein